MRPSEELRRLRREITDLEAYCALLKGVLMAEGIDPPSRSPVSLRGLNVQENTLLGLLLHAWPSPLNRYDLLERIPSRSVLNDPLDRQGQLVSILVVRLRKRLGSEAIETVWGHGYRLSDGLRAELLAAGCVSG